MKKASTLMTQDEARKFSAGVAALRERFDLSLRDLSNACGGTKSGVSKATAERICNGKISLEHASRIKPVVFEHLHSFLRRHGLTEKEAFNQLKSISTGKEHKELIIQKTNLPLTAQAFFGLRRDPFDPSKSDPRDVSEAFTSPALEQIAAAVEDTINYQRFVAVVGEIGSGKSLLKCRVIEAAEHSNGKQRILWPEFLEMKKVRAAPVVSFVLNAFNQSVPQDLLARAAKLKHTLANASEDVRVALGFDEAHRLNNDTLSALKNFYELGTGGYMRYLGIVLFGQPMLKSRLQSYEFRELAERIEIIEMPSFSKCAWEYLGHRTKLSGGDIEKLFERKAVDLLAAQAETPLALGNLANAALIKAHRLGERKVLAAFIEGAKSEPRVRAMRRAAS